jgi:hypothetical protein
MDERQGNVVTGWDVETCEPGVHDTGVTVGTTGGSSPTQGIDTPISEERTPDRAPPAIVFDGSLPREVTESLELPGSLRFYPAEERPKGAPQAGAAAPESRPAVALTCWGCGRTAADDRTFEALYETVPVQGFKVSRCRMCGAGMLCFEAGFFTDTDVEELRAHFERAAAVVSP